MYKLPSIAGVSAAALLFACAPSGADGPGERATRLTVREPGFSRAEIVVLKSLPPKFELVLQREMPTPGWSFEQDDVEVDAEAGRIVVRLSEIAPKGVVTQVLTLTACRIPLGTLEPGRYVVEIRLRRGSSGRHEPVHALVVEAR